MNKLTIIISILITLITILYLVLDYKGVFRNMRLCSSSNTAGYLEKYKTLPKADKNKVVLVISDPQSGSNAQFINSILDQTVRVNDICLVVPDSEKKAVNNPHKIFTMCGYNKDYGKNANVIIPLTREREADTKIILIHSGIAYGIDFVETMVDMSNKNPTNVISGLFKGKEIAMLYKPSFVSNIEDVKLPNKVEVDLTYNTYKTRL